MDRVEKILTKNGINVKIGKGKGQLNDGQVFGCEFYPATELKKEISDSIPSMAPDLFFVSIDRDIKGDLESLLKILIPM